LIKLDKMMLEHTTEKDIHKGDPTPTAFFSLTPSLASKRQQASRPLCHFLNFLNNPT
jgi:molybdenum cofactor biosynthesis enzyme